jgi:hypothetical protein
MKMRTPPACCVAKPASVSAKARRREPDELVAAAERAFVAAVEAITVGQKLLDQLEDAADLAGLSLDAAVERARLAGCHVDDLEVRVAGRAKAA